MVLLVYSTFGWLVVRLVGQFVGLGKDLLGEFQVTLKDHEPHWCHPDGIGCAVDDDAGRDTAGFEGALDDIGVDGAAILLENYNFFFLFHCLDLMIGRDRVTARMNVT